MLFLQSGAACLRDDILAPLFLNLKPFGIFALPGKLLPAGSFDLGQCPVRVAVQKPPLG